jgi:putative hemolysin
MTALMALAMIFNATACSDQTAEPLPGDSVGLPNPAAVFCEEQGGEYLLDTGECRLADGTVRDAWDYYRENAEPGDQRR